MHNGRYLLNSLVGEDEMSATDVSPPSTTISVTPPKRYSNGCARKLCAVAQTSLSTTSLARATNSEMKPAT
jgi:hypothetical protein